MNGTCLERRFNVLESPGNGCLRPRCTCLGRRLWIAKADGKLLFWSKIVLQLFLGLWWLAPTATKPTGLALLHEAANSPNCIDQAGFEQYRPQRWSLQRPVSCHVRRPTSGCGQRLADLSLLIRRRGPVNPRLEDSRPGAQGQPWTSY